MKQIQNIALICVASFGLAGCATVVNGTSQSYVIDSNPHGAAVTLTDGTTCTTPCKLKLKRRHDLRVDITHPGYKATYVLVQSKWGGASAGNILLGGLIGTVVDSSNGSSNHLSPNPLKVNLVAEGAEGDAVLLDKNGKQVSAVMAHNDKVRADVAKTIGAQAAGITSQPAAPAANAEPAAIAAPAETTPAGDESPAAPVAAAAPVAGQ